MRSKLWKNHIRNYSGLKMLSRVLSKTIYLTLRYYMKNIVYNYPNDEFNFFSNDVVLSFEYS